MRVWARIGRRDGRWYRSLTDVVEDAQLHAGDTPPGSVAAVVWPVDAAGEGDPLRLLLRGRGGGWRWYDADAAPAHGVSDAAAALADGARQADAAYAGRPGTS